MQIKSNLGTQNSVPAGPAPSTTLTSVSDGFPQEGSDGLLEQATISLDLLPWNHRTQLQAEEAHFTSPNDTVHAHLEVNAEE